MTFANTAEQLDPKYWLAGTDETRSRILHTMVRIKNPDASLRFYVEGLGMKLVHRYDIEARRLTALFLSFDEASTDGFLELAHYWDTETDFSHGTGYGHVAIGVPDFAAALARLDAMGVETSLAPYTMFPDGPYLAMVKDPDGYSVEIIQANRSG